MIPYILFVALVWGIALLRIGNGAKVLLVGIVAVYFIGFRYEVGYDWPVYKTEFENLHSMGLGNILTHLRDIQADTQHELGFILLATAVSRVFSAYEFFQCFVFLIFFMSIWYLAKALRSHNPMAAFAMMQPFILITLEFSTLRQSIAIAFFNFGIYWLSRQRRGFGLLCFALAVAMQISAIIYVLVYLVSIGANRKTTTLAIFGIIAASILSAPAAIFAVAGFLPAFASTKIAYYLFDRTYDSSILEQIFSVALYIFAAYSCWRVSRINRDRLSKSQLWAVNYVLVSALFALAFIWLPVMRNRLMYEFIIIFALMLFSRLGESLSKARMIMFGLSAVMMAVLLFKPLRYVYIPYQNYLWYQATNQTSDGWERQDYLFSHMGDH